ncbi:MAG: hypothetical protein HC936_19265 [Leptolyngbyaceae cyanobacterium SU_3_3]|nr:hypothetical protein [Leptolyngbyaceae cyanobacterium SU_3_3]
MLTISERSTSLGRSWLPRTFVITALSFGGFLSCGLFLALPQVVYAQASDLEKRGEPTEELDDLLQQGREFLDNGNLADALATYQRAAEIDVKIPVSFLGLATSMPKKVTFRKQ